jgi:hypothetical protein
MVPERYEIHMNGCEQYRNSMSGTGCYSTVPRVCKVVGMSFIEEYMEFMSSVVPPRAFVIDEAFLCLGIEDVSATFYTSE